jgi:hypothetical protein
MAFEIVVKPIVFIDIDEAVNYYTQESDLLAERFYNSVISKIEHIQQNPTNFGFYMQMCGVQDCLVFLSGYFFLFRVSRLLS